MPVYVSMLRGVNLFGRAVRMDRLRSMYQSLRLSEVQTYIQSGNVLFRSRMSDELKVRRLLEGAIEKEFAMKSEVFLRTTSEMRGIVAANPFDGREDVAPNKLIVTFLQIAPGKDMLHAIAKLPVISEEFRVRGREIYGYFPDGLGRSKVAPLLDRLLKAHATSRNWNTVTKMLEMASRISE